MSSECPFDEPKTPPVQEILGEYNYPSSPEFPEPWGQLIPYNKPTGGRGILDVKDNSRQNKYGSQKTRILLGMISMIKDRYMVGKTSIMDIVLSTENINPRFIPVISKVHFIITREFVTANNDFVVVLYDTSTNGTFVNGNLIGNGNRVVLTHNDTISIARADFKVYHFELSEPSHIKLPADLSKEYIGLRKLGSGVCGEVKLIFSRKKFCALALKTINIKQTRPTKMMHEVNILKALSHPNIIKMYDVINSPLNVYIMLELMQGGELYDRVDKSDGLPEVVAKFHFYQIASAVAYLHSQGITHRDLKPENILLLNNDDYTVCKVADFGMSKLVDSKTMMKTGCGTPRFMAPEILKGEKYTSQVDVWSLGVILFFMLSNRMPFSAASTKALYETIKKGNFDYTHEEFYDKSDSVISLINGMLEVNPTQRLTIERAMTSTWLKDSSLISKIRDTVEFFCKSDENKNPNVDSGISRMEHNN